jgi:hypothetical protein
VEYRGALSEDGNIITGTWELRVRTFFLRHNVIRGVWEARRQWADEMEEIAEPEDAGLLEYVQPLLRS